MAITQKSFADYVKDLMSVLPTVNDNPMLSITSQTDAAKYRENPFYMQEAIRKRIAEEEAAKAGQSKSGMFGSMPSSGGDGAGGGRNYYQEIEDRFYQENLARGATPEAARTLAERQAFEIQSANNLPIANFLTDMGKVGIGGLLTQIAGSSLFGNKLLDTRAPTVDRNIYRPDAIQEAIARAQSQAAGLSGQSSYNNPSIQALIANDILAREAQNVAMTQAYRDIGGFKDKGTYISSYGTSTPTYGSMSDDTARGLAAARDSFGYGTDADYYGD